MSLVRFTLPAANTIASICDRQSIIHSMDADYRLHCLAEFTVHGREVLVMLMLLVGDSDTCTREMYRRAFLP